MLNMHLVWNLMEYLHLACLHRSQSSRREPKMRKLRESRGWRRGTRLGQWSARNVRKRGRNVRKKLGLRKREGRKIVFIGVEHAPEVDRDLDLCLDHAPEVEIARGGESNFCSRFAYLCSN